MADSTSYARYSGLTTSATGVTSLDGLTGALTLVAGTGISIADGVNTITISSTSAGDVTIGAFGSTPNANGLSINGSQVLNMQPADATHPGGISIADWNTFNNKQAALAITNLTDVGTDGITVTNGTGAVIGASPVTIAQHVADTTHNGYLSSTDWNTFNGKGTGTVTAVSVTSSNGFAGASSGGATPTLTLSTTITGILQGNGTAISAATTGNLTDAGTDGITVTSGTGAVLGSGTSIAQHVADTTHNGYLSSADWNTFNGKGAGTVTSVAMTVPTFLSIAGTPITTSGTLALTLSGTALPVANGGTGQTSLTAHSVLVGNTTTGVTQVATSATAGQPLLSNGSSSDPSFQAVAQRKITTYASGSGNHTTTSGCVRCTVQMVGAGGGGAGSAALANNDGGNGTTPSATTFDNLTCNGGTGGVGGLNGGQGGGTATVGAGWTTIWAVKGGSGGGASAWLATATASAASGGSSALGGAGGGPTGNNGGPAGVANTGGGGAGASASVPCVTGASGGAGGYIEAQITPTITGQTFAYVNRAGGAGGGAGTSGNGGGAGGSSYIVVIEDFI